MKKITVKIDGDEVKVETSGFPGMTCHNELEALDLPVGVTRDVNQPNKGVAVAERAYQT